MTSARLFEVPSRLTIVGQLRAQGLEPWTHGLKGKRTRVQGTQSQALTSDGAPVCCPVCSADTENRRAELVNAGPEHVAGTSSPTQSAGAADTGNEPGGTLAAALAMIAGLPLTPAEKADAVRRLLAEQAVKGKP